MIVTLDGPAGAGKSTAARRLAARLGVRYLDSGAIYRAVTLVALESRLAPTDGAALGTLAASLDIDLRPDGRVFVGTRDITREIRSEAVSGNVSAVSAHPEVRRALLELQRSIGARGDLVCDGRDMGSVVFPNADHKFFIEAEVTVRAGRRQRELLEKGDVVAIPEVVDRLTERDRLDSTRAASPLVRAKDAVVIDTTAMGIDEVVDHLAGLVGSRRV